MLILHAFGIKAAHLTTDSTGMLNNLRHHLPVPQYTPQLLWQRLFYIIIILAAPWHIDVYASTLTRQYFGIQRIRRKVDSGSIDLIQEDCRQRAQYLQLELGTLDHIDRADKRIDDKRALKAIIH